SLSGGGGGGRVAIYRGGTLVNTGVVTASGGAGGFQLGETTLTRQLKDGQHGTVYGLGAGEGITSNITSAHWPIPADGVGSIAIGTGTVNLTWLPGLGSTTSVVHFGTTTNPGLLTSITGDRARKSAAAPVALNTRYFWRVVSNGVPGPLWSFRTVGYEARNPVPAAGAVYVSPTDLQLQWQDGHSPATITRRDVFFGTDQVAVATATSTSPLRIAVLTGAGTPGVPRTLNLSPLLANTQYFWRVDTYWSGYPTSVEGLVWNFTTRAPACRGVLAGDFNDDCKVTFIDFALLAANWGLCNLPNQLNCN
ncbi:MAG TPA: hypothetical protein VLH60_02680, partial [Sedimentisphaerales bacterium]|nr:hypothetical protein [Sedimentisphaerales bacterium]